MSWGKTPRSSEVVCWRGHCSVRGREFQLTFSGGSLWCPRPLRVGASASHEISHVRKRYSITYPSLSVYTEPTYRLTCHTDAHRARGSFIPKGGTPRKIGWGCAAHFPKPLLYCIIALLLIQSRSQSLRSSWPAVRKREILIATISSMRIDADCLVKSDGQYSISFPELRSPWPAVGKRELRHAL